MVTRTKKLEPQPTEPVDVVSEALTTEEEPVLIESEIPIQMASEEPVRLSSFFTLEQWANIYLHENPNDQFLVYAFKTIGAAKGPHHDTGKNWDDRFKAWGSSPA